MDIAKGGVLLGGTMNSRKSTFLLLGTLFVFACTFVFFSMNHAAFPGNDPNHPLGWWGWYDQGEYLKLLKLILSDGRIALNAGAYPPGFAVVSMPISMLLEPFVQESAGYGLIVTNGMLVFTSLVVFSCAMKEYRAVIFVLMCIALVIFIPAIRNALIIPWSSSVSLLVTSIFFYIVIRRRLIFDLNYFSIFIFLGYGLLLSLLLHTRPQDFATISLASLIYLLTSIFKGKFPSIVFVAIVCFLFSELILYFLTGDFALGAMYGKSPHTFIPLGVFDKFIGLISGDISYGVDSMSFHNNSPVAWVFILGILIFGFILSPLPFKVLLVSWAAVYLSFSDLGPHNLLKYELVHYLKSPILLSLSTSILYFNYTRLLVSSLVVLMLTMLRLDVVFSSGTESMDLLSSGSLKFYNVKIPSHSDGLYVSPVAPLDKHKVFFDPPVIYLDDKKLLPFTDYRVFVGKSGFYFNFLTPQEGVFDVKMDTSNITSMCGGLYKAEIYPYSRNVNVLGGIL